MEIVGDQSLISDLHHREVLGKNGIRRRRILVGTPGIKAGVVGAKRMQAMADHGIPADHFDVVVGTSASSWNGAAYCANQAHIAADVYAHLCEVQFLFPTWLGDWMNLAYLVRLLRGEIFPNWRLDQQTIRANHPELLIAVSDMYGKLSLEEAKQADDVLELCHTSSAAPVLVGGRFINGMRKFDGGCADPCPVRQVLRDTVTAGEEVDVFVVASRPEQTSLIESWAFWTLVHSSLALFPPSFRISTAAMDRKIARLGQMFRKERASNRFRLCAVFPTEDECVFPLEWRAPMVRAGGELSYSNFSRFLNTMRPRREI